MPVRVPEVRGDGDEPAAPATKIVAISESAAGDDHQHHDVMRLVLPVVSQAAP